MRNSDQVTEVCFTTGGNTAAGQDMGTKVRFTNDKVRRVKIFQRLGVQSQHWVSLGRPMTKAEAVTYLQSTEDNTIRSNTAYQDAIAHAAARLL